MSMHFFLIKVLVKRFFCRTIQYATTLFALQADIDDFYLFLVAGGCLLDIKISIFFAESSKKATRLHAARQKEVRGE
jgi:hypothetical protein